MLYLSGKLVRMAGIGAMVTPESYRRAAFPEASYAVDTGCFANPSGFDPSTYLDFLGKMAEAHGVGLFATAPDVFGDGPATWAVAAPMLPRIAAAGWPAAMVVQPGTPDPPWDDLGALFVGGPDAWQTSERCFALVREAQDRGIWTHKGRVNTRSRLRAAVTWGFDSADGTLLAFGSDANMPRLKRWLGELEGQGCLIA